MTAKKLLSPDYIFESSWEVCNKVGGIYTVLSTRAKTMQDKYADKVIFVGPDVWEGNENPLFKEDSRLMSEWKKVAESEGLHIRIGRWTVPGKPIAVLVSFNQFFAEKDSIYGWLWENFQVDSLHSYGDYDEASMFSYAAGRVVESWWNFTQNELKKAKSRKKLNVVYQAHEWMTCLGALYLQKKVPEIATIFTTHATSIGRSIAGNNKPLYDCLKGYDGDQMARELNMESKHSIEKQTAFYVDCFTTVSDLTAKECAQLLEVTPDVVLTNGFEDSFVPGEGRTFATRRHSARKKLLQVANTLMGTNLKDDTVIISMGGRYEFKNKGIDMLVDSMNRLRLDPTLEKNVLVFVNVPAWMKCPGTELRSRLENQMTTDVPCYEPRLTHELYNYDEDKVVSQMNWLDIHNRKEDKVKIIFVPSYLDGHDGIFDVQYYDLLIGNDLAIYPSYYEPWGYTPLESVAFHVPCITTDLAGFGLWATEFEEENGVKVIHRSDSNFVEASEQIKNIVLDFTNKSAKEIEELRNSAARIAEKALWQHFIENYYKAYDCALKNRNERIKSNK